MTIYQELINWFEIYYHPLYFMCAINQLFLKILIYLDLCRRNIQLKFIYLFQLLNISLFSSKSKERIQYFLPSEEGAE